MTPQKRIEDLEDALREIAVNCPGDARQMAQETLNAKYVRPAIRKPSELTPSEIAYCQDCLPGSWEYDHSDNTIFSTSDRPGKALPMKYIKLLTDYLTSINVNPYGE